MTNPTQSQQRASTEASDPSPETRTNPRFARSDEPPVDELEQVQLAIEMGKTWVRQHQTAAMLGAFAVGTFIGALMRD